LVLIFDSVIHNTNFNNAKLGDSIFADVNLSNALNLDSCSFLRPFTIDHRTLQKSGKLPDEFLRGCGLSDWQIEETKLYQPNLIDTQILNIQQRVFELISTRPVISFYSCFISYSHEDKKFAKEIHDILQNKGIRVWLDEHQLLPGDNIYKAIDCGIHLWDKVLLCCSKASLTSWWVDKEIEKGEISGGELQLVSRFFS